MREFLKHQIPIGYLNYFRFFKNMVAGKPFSSNQLPAIFNEIIQTNYWNGADSICGATSGVEATAGLRVDLQQLITAYSIQSILDIPCGDFVWMSEMNLHGIRYTGADIVETMILDNRQRYKAPNLRFECLDLTSATLPKVDLVICRDCLVHLSFNHIRKALKNIKNSGSTWLLCTSFVQNQFNYNIADGDWRTLNMQKRPFRFPKPMRSITDNHLLEHSVFSDKTLCLWRLSDLVVE